jgi:hypothetical protein
MVLYPTHNDATTCQQCHPEDYEARAKRFMEITGVGQIHPVPPTSAQVKMETGSPLSIPRFEARLLEPWRLAGLILLGTALIPITIFGYRCWRADRLARNNK